MSTSMLSGAKIAQEIREAIVNEQADAFRSEVRVQSDDGRDIPLIWGCVRVRTPALVWWGDVQPARVKKDGETIAWRYSYGLVLVLAAVGPNSAGIAARLRRVWCGDALMFNLDSFKSPSGDPTSPIGAVNKDGGRLFQTLSSLNFWGAPGEGGSFGTSDILFYPGNFDQTANDYLVSLSELGANKVSGYRGFCGVVFEGASHGEQKRIPEYQFEVEYLPNAVGSGATAIDDSTNSVSDANPVEVLFDIITNPWGRVGLESGDVDIPSFFDAARTVRDEGNGCSVLWERAAPAVDLIEQLLDQIDGALYLDSNGRIAITLIRDDYTVGALDLLDESNVSEVLDFSVETPDGRPNQVRVRYTSRTDDYEERSVLAQDQAHFQVSAGNAIVTTDLRFPFVTQAGLAARLAARELRQRTASLRRLRVRLNRDAFGWYRGQAFRFSWSDYGVTDAVFRVAEISYGTLEDPTMEIEAVEDVFSVESAIYSTPNPQPAYPVTITPVEPVDDDVIELPGVLVNWTEGEGFSITDDDPRFFAFAKAADADGGDGFAVGIQKSDGSRDIADKDFRAHAYTEHAEVDTEYDRADSPYDTTTGLIVKNVSDSSLLLSATSTEIQEKGKNLIRVGNELMAFESVADLGSGRYRLNNVWRALIDTVADTHAVGTRVWLMGTDTDNGFRTGSQMRKTTRTKALPGDTLTVRPLASNGAKLVDLDSATAGTSIEVKARARLTLPVANLLIDGLKEALGDSKVGIHNNVTATFARRATGATTIIRGDAADEAPTASEVYWMTWLPDDGGAEETMRSDISGNAYVESGVDRSIGAGRIQIETVQLVTQSSNGRTYSGDALFAAYIPATVISARQLLANPGFEWADPSDQWPEVPDPNFVASASSYGFAGTHCLAFSSTIQLNQTILDLDEIDGDFVGYKALVRWKERNLGSSGASVRVRLISLDSGASAVDTADSGTSTPATGSWDNNEVAIASIGATAVSLRVTVDLTYNGVGPVKGAIDELDLRLAPRISSNLLTNGGWNSGTTGWTVSRYTTGSANLTEGSAHATGDGTTGAGYVEQIVSVPSDAQPGDLVHLRFIAYDNGNGDEMTAAVQVRNSGGTVLDENEFATDEVVPNDSEWHLFEGYVRIPSSAAFDLKVRVDVTPTGATAPTLDLDDFDLRVYAERVHGTSDGVATASGAAGSTVTVAGTSAGLAAAFGYKEI
jgi:hypothetical protein